MLVNLLCRLEGVVQRVGVCCPADVPLVGRVIPLAAREADLRTALLDGASAVKVVPVEPNVRLERSIAVGGRRGTRAGADLYACGHGWCGGVGTSADIAAGLNDGDHGGRGNSALPFGPYLAACLAAGEVFKAARLLPGVYHCPTSAVYSLWEHRAAPSAALLTNGPPTLAVAVDAALAGVGAVGSALVHTLWACPGVTGQLLAADGDPDGLDGSNLNRYALFGRASVGRPKASEAARIAADASFEVVSHDGDFERLSDVPPRVVSAVDRNTSRAALQNRYPARILSASTLDLRAEVLRCGPPGVGACLRCFNPPELPEPDENLRARVREAGPEELAALARAAGVTPADAREWAETGGCGTAGERLLPELRRNPGEPAFAVGFVSVMAGTMLAAELIKDYFATAVPLGHGAQRATFQFHTPLARTNRAAPYARDLACPMCAESTIARRLWSERFDALGPPRGC